MRSPLPTILHKLEEFHKFAQGKIWRDITNTWKKPFAVRIPGGVHSLEFHQAGFRETKPEAPDKTQLDLKRFFFRALQPGTWIVCERTCLFVHVLLFHVTPTASMFQFIVHVHKFLMGLLLPLAILFVERKTMKFEWLRGGGSQLLNVHDLVNSAKRTMKSSD